MFKNTRYIDYGDCIYEVIQSTEKIISKNSKLYWLRDVRTLSFKNILQVLQWVLAINNILSKWNVGNPETDNIISQLTGLLNPNPKNSVIARDNINKINKISFCTIIQSQIENLITNIAIHRGFIERNNRIGFFRKLQKILEELKIELWIMDYFNVTGNIRNSLHSNWVHYWKDLKINIGWIQYNFTHGEIIRCASTAHIAHAFQKIISILDEQILDHDLIKFPIELIKDEYWEQEYWREI